MKKAVSARMTLAVAGLLAVSAAGACQNMSTSKEPDRSVDTRGPADRADAVPTDRAATHEGAPITLTGCLQKTGRVMSTYILTRVNEPSEAVGTSGAKDAGTVEREQIREAWHSYRINAEKQDLDKLVGKQVRVTGTLTDTADLKTNGEQARAKSDSTSRTDLDAGDLARVDATSVETISDSCGAGAERSPRQRDNNRR